MPEPWTVEEWARFCRDNFHFADERQHPYAICLDCARVYARQVGEAHVAKMMDLLYGGGVDDEEEDRLRALLVETP